MASRSWIGLDLGTTGFKVVKVAAQGSSFRIIRAAVYPWSTGPEPREQQLRVALEAFGSRQAHIGLDGRDVTVRRVRLPQLSPQEVPEAVRWQIKDQLPFPAQDARLATRIVETIRTNDAPQIDVLVAAATQAAADAPVAWATQAGLNAASLCPNSVALVQAVRALYPDAAALPAFAVMDIGASQTHLAVAAFGHVRVVRDLAIGGDTVNQALTGVVSTERGEVEIDSALAETLKRRYGVVASEEDRLSEEGIPLRHLAALMRPVLENLLTEARRFLDFYRVQIDERGVSRLYVCGGGASTRGLTEALEEGLGIPVTGVDPLAVADQGAFIGSEPTESDGPRLAVAFGLAVGHGGGLNLIGRPSSGADSPVVASWAIRAGLGIAAIGLLAAAGLGLALWQAHHALRSLESRWTKVEPAYTEYQRLSREERQLQGMLSTVETLRANRPLWDGLLNELAAVIPDPIRLTALRAERTDKTSPASAMRLRIEGQAGKDGTQAQAELVGFVEALEASVFFSRVELVRSQRPADPSQPLQFELSVEPE